MESLPLTSRIEEVTVYRRGARITRVAELKLNGDGASSAVRFTGLPLCLEDGSVRVRVEPVEGASHTVPVVASDTRVALDVTPPSDDDERLPAEAGELIEARRENVRATLLVGQIRREIDRLSKLGVVPRPEASEGKPPVASPVEARLALVELRDGLKRKLLEELEDAKAAQDAAARRLEAAEDRDRRRTTARKAREHELRKTVLVTLRPNGDGAKGKARLALEYVVPGARWAPAYTAQLDGGMTKASLAMRAVVAQQTGEDWSRVRLKLSTAKPQSFTELPELPSLRIGREQPKAKKGFRPPPVGLDDLFRDYDRAFAASTEGPDAPRDEEAHEAARVLAEELVSEIYRYHHHKLHPRKKERNRTALRDVVEKARERYARETPAAVRASHDYFGEEVERLLAGDIQVAPPMGGAVVADAAMPAPAAAEAVTLAAGGETAELYEALELSEPETTFDAAPAASPSLSAAVFGAAAPPSSRAKRGGTPTRLAARVAKAAPRDTGPAPLLDYGRLVMPPPMEGKEGRGTLRLVETKELYVELFVRERVELSFDVMTAAQDAVERAQAAGENDLPHGHRWAAGDRAYDYAYVAESPVDVASDGACHAVPVTTRETSVEPRHIVVPRETCDVFRIARITNPLDAPLLEGPLDVYRDGSFLITSRVAFTPPRADVQVGLGVEQRIKLARNTHFNERTAGLMSGQLGLAHEIVVDAQNHTAVPVTLEVRERVPITGPKEDDIKVHIGKVEPAWEAFEPPAIEGSDRKLRGGRRWVVALEPGESTTLRASYEIRIPAKYELVDGNRRES